MVVIQIKIDKNWSQLYDEDVLGANYNYLYLLLMIVNVFSIPLQWMPPWREVLRLIRHNRHSCWRENHSHIVDTFYHWFIIITIV